MQPILMLAVVGVAAAALGTGFLNNDIELWIQQFGVGSGDISTPTDHITVDFNIAQTLDETTDTWSNDIDKCILTPDDDVGVGPNGADGLADAGVDGIPGNDDDPEVQDDPDKYSSLTCKLTGKDLETWEPNGQIITEGKVCAWNFPAGVPVMVPMGVTCDEIAMTTSTLNGASTSEDVKLVGDVIVVAHANTYSPGD